MKIAIDARFYGHENGGLGRYTMNLLRELAKVDSKNEYVIVIREAYSGKLNLPQNFSEVVVEARHYSFLEQVLLPLVLFRINADITHFLHFNVPLLYRKPFVVTVHDMIMHHVQSSEATTLAWPIYKIKRIVYFLTFRNAVLSARRIITPTETVKTEVSKYYNVAPKKIFVTNEGIDTKIRAVKTREFIKENKLDAQYFLYVGNAYPHKNIPIAVEALLSLNQEVKQKIHLVLVTPRDFFFDKLTSFVKERGAENVVHILRNVSDMNLSELYSHAVAFVYPSLIEGFGLPALEAMSVGTPTIVSDIPVFHEVYEDQALYFDPKLSDSLVDQMQSVLALKVSRRERLSKELMHYTKKYSWSSMAHDTLAVYEA